MKMKKFQILNPDGFLINFEEYTSPEKAWQGFNEWKSHFISQGYYNSKQGRICLSELNQYCTLISFKS